MQYEDHLQIFQTAHLVNFSRALAEVTAGRKQTHWMWFIFPQLKGLGSSAAANLYGLVGPDEAKAYLEHPLLGSNLLTISAQLLKLPANNPESIFEYPDNLKLHSCMTLFATLQSTDPVFRHVLEKFFSGILDKRTLRLLQLSYDT